MRLAHICAQFIVHTTTYQPVAHNSKIQIARRAKARLPTFTYYSFLWCSVAGALRATGSIAVCDLTKVSLIKTKFYRFDYMSFSHAFPRR